MNKTYLIFEWDTCDGDTIVHGYVTGDKEKVKAVAKRTLRELKNKLGREEIYYCELPNLEANNVDLSSYVIFDHTENATKLTYPCGCKEEIELMIETSVSDSELNLVDAILEECYMNDEIDIEEHDKLSKYLDVKRVSLFVPNVFEPRRELIKKINTMLDTLGDDDMIELNNHIVKLTNKK
ncbi:hypothetical protein [Paraclostridium bifermentans]|uniref:hypothetical protein n=1 Tax=Paraclostridium bifermentans TaxID=1490 RepID=UPI00374EDE5C